MERTSLITALYIGVASKFPLITWTDGFPDTGSLTTHFTKVPVILEKADIRETVEESDQGQLKDVAIRANVHREVTLHSIFENTHVMAYIETANGERHFFGSNDNPLTFMYTRDSGSGNADPRETTLMMGQKLPL